MNQVLRLSFISHFEIASFFIVHDLSFTIEYRDQSEKITIGNNESVRMYLNHSLN
jgi:hypothetical protein